MRYSRRLRRQDDEFCSASGEFGHRGVYGAGVTTSSPLIESLAGIIESVVRRVAGPVEVVDGALSAGLDSAASAVSVLPAPIVIALVGLLVWSGWRLLRAVVVVIALHLIVLSGLWTSLVATVLLGVVAGAVGSTLAFGFMYATRPVRRRLPSSSGLGAGATVSMIVVIAVAITALFGTSVQPAWNLSAILLAAGLAMPGRLFERRELTWQRLGLGVFEQGVAAALLIGTVSGAGLGGLAARAATTADIGLSLQVLLALTGVVVALFAATARDAPGLEEASDDEPAATPLGPDLSGERP